MLSIEERYFSVRTTMLFTSQRKAIGRYHNALKTSFSFQFANIQNVMYHYYKLKSYPSLSRTVHIIALVPERKEKASARVSVEAKDSES